MVTIFGRTWYSPEVRPRDNREAEDVPLPLKSSNDDVDPDASLRDREERRGNTVG